MDPRAMLDQVYTVDSIGTQKIVHSSDADPDLKDPHHFAGSGSEISFTGSGFRSRSQPKLIKMLKLKVI